MDLLSKLKVTSRNNDTLEERTLDGLMLQVDTTPAMERELIELERMSFRHSKERKIEFLLISCGIEPIDRRFYLNCMKHKRHAPLDDDSLDSYYSVAYSGRLRGRSDESLVSEARQKLKDIESKLDRVGFLEEFQELNRSLRVTSIQKIGAKAVADQSDESEIDQLMFGSDLSLRARRALGALKIKTREELFALGDPGNNWPRNCGKVTQEELVRFISSIRRDEPIAEQSNPADPRAGG